MQIPLVQIEWMGWRISSLTPDHILRVIPEAGYPRGRKGKLLADIWAGVYGLGADGLVLMDPDVVADPDDWAALAGAASSDPTSVHTGVLKLWPASTGLTGWIWSHRGGRLGYPENTQDERARIAYVSTGFVYLPGRLLDAASAWLPGAHFLDVDPGLSETALQAGIPMLAVPACRPKHVHFTEAHNEAIPKPLPSAAGPPAGGHYHPPAP